MSEGDPSLHRAGRGFLWLTAAKLHFMMAGWAVYFLLPQLMSEVDWGRFIVVLFLVTILNNVMVSSGVQGVSRFTASAGRAGAGAGPASGPAWAALRGGLGLFLVIGALGAGALALGAPFIAAAHSDPGLASLYRVAAPVAFGYALYAACVGSLNGRQRFGTQAAFDVTYATIRLGLMVAGALVAGRALAATGAHAGYSVAALAICGLALLVVAFPLWRRSRDPSGEGSHEGLGASGPGAVDGPGTAGPGAADGPGAAEGPGTAGPGAAESPGAAGPGAAEGPGPTQGPSWRTLLVFVLPLAAHQLGLNLLMRIDPLLLKALGGRVVSDTAALASASSLADATSVLTGRYATAQVFALVPYQALIALSMVVFPLVADAAAAERREAMRNTAAGALRFALIFGAGLAAALSARPADVIDLVYPASYRPGGLALRYMAWGVVGLSVITLSSAMLNAAGRTGRVLAITFGTFGVQAIAVVGVLHLVGSPEAALGYTALVAAVVLLAGAIVAALVLRATFGVPLPLATALRVAPAAALATLAGALVPGQGALFTLAVGAGVLALYLALLFVFREIGHTELAAVRRVLGRRG